MLAKASIHARAPPPTPRAPWSAGAHLRRFSASGVTTNSLTRSDSFAGRCAVHNKWTAATCRRRQGPRPAPTKLALLASIKRRLRPDWPAPRRERRYFVAKSAKSSLCPSTAASCKIADCNAAYLRATTCDVRETIRTLWGGLGSSVPYWGASWSETCRPANAQRCTPLRRRRRANIMRHPKSR